MRSTEFDDPRVSYYWDRYKISGTEWQEVINLRNVAWDIYFLYGADDSWGEIPTYPEFFMNQIGLPEDISPHLEGELLSEKLGEYMKAIK